MPELLRPPVEPASDEVAARVRARVLAGERPPRRSRRTRGALLATATAAGMAVAFAVAITQVGGSQTPAFAAESVRAAEASPRLLLRGWTVSRVDEWAAGTGEMTFGRGGATVELSWGPEVRPGGKPGEPRVATTEVGGARAVVRRYAGTGDYTARWRHRGTPVVLRGPAASPAAFADILATVASVGAEQWLRALPPTAVTPRESSSAIAGMLDGLPLPPDFRRPSADGARDPYQLGARVSGAVACGWVAAWLAARSAGDEAGEREAAAALASSRDWPVLREMNADGDFPEVVWQYADAVNGTGEIPAGKLGLTAEETYVEALGCP